MSQVATQMEITQHECELIMDHCLGCTDQVGTEQIHSLITTEPVAAQLHELIEQAIACLDLIGQPDCPDKLVDLTIARLKLAAFSRR